MIEWKVVVKDLKSFEVVLGFNHPDLVSTDGLDPDKILFELNRPQMFTSLESNQPAVILPAQKDYFD